MVTIEYRTSHTVQLTYVPMHAQTDIDRAQSGKRFFFFVALRWCAIAIRSTRLRYEYFFCFSIHIHTEAHRQVHTFLSIYCAIVDITYNTVLYDILNRK